MALCPFAIHKLIPPGVNDPRIDPDTLVLHVAVSTSDSLHDFFTHDGGIESHFYIRSTGVIEQYRDTSFQADAQLGRGFDAISVETEGLGAGTWTRRQLGAITKLIHWAHGAHPKITLAPATSPAGPGIGYHAQFDEWNPNHHLCPGALRISQFERVLVPWLKSQNVKPLPTKVRNIVTWNVEKGRTEAAVMADLKAIIAEVKHHTGHAPDVMMVQEVSGYHNVTTMVPGFALAVHAGDNGILVNGNLPVTSHKTVEVLDSGWFTFRGGKHPNLWIVQVLVDNLNLWTGHTPPTVQTKLQRLRSPRRWVAYQHVMAAFEKAVTPGGLHIIGNDWNVDAQSDNGSVARFPASEAKAMHMVRRFPGVATHFNRVIDYFFTRGLSAFDKHLTVLNVGHSDHKPVLLQLTPKGTK